MTESVEKPYGVPECAPRDVHASAWSALRCSILLCRQIHGKRVMNCLMSDEVKEEGNNERIP